MPDGAPTTKSAFTAEQIELYTKFDFIMIAMLNQTAKQVPCPGPMECDFVPQGTAMSVQQAAAIKAAEEAAAAAKAAEEAAAKKAAEEAAAKKAAEEAAAKAAFGLEGFEWGETL